MKFSNKTAIITGAGRDIGRACAMKLAAEGASVALNYFASSEGADTAVAEITATEGPSEIHRVDQERVAIISAGLRYGDLGSAVKEVRNLLATTPLAVPAVITASIWSSESFQLRSFSRAAAYRLG